MAEPLEGKRILITGPSGQVALPVTRALAANNDVIGIARFRDPATRTELEALGVTCIPTDLAAGDFVRRCKQLVDLLGQVAVSTDDDALRRSALAAVDLVLRGVVAHSTVA